MVLSNNRPPMSVNETTHPHPVHEVVKGIVITVRIDEIPLESEETIVEIGIGLEPSKNELMAIVLTSRERNFWIDRNGNIYKGNYGVYDKN